MNKKSFLIQIILRDFTLRTPNATTCGKFLREFNSLTPEERYQFLTYVDIVDIGERTPVCVLAEDIFNMVSFAITHAGSKTSALLSPGFISGYLDGKRFTIEKKIINRRILRFDGLKTEFTTYGKSFTPDAIKAAKRLADFMVGVRRKQ